MSHYGLPSSLPHQPKFTILGSIRMYVRISMSSTACMGESTNVNPGLIWINVNPKRLFNHFNQPQFINQGEKPSGKHTKSYNGPVEIVDLPMKNGGSFHSYVKLPEGNIEPSRITHQDPAVVHICRFRFQELPRCGGW